MKPLVAMLVVLAGAASAAAEPCAARDPKGDPFAACFDPGNRLLLFGGAGSAEGALVGAGLYLRHLVATDDPGVTWRLEHVLGEGLVGRDGWRAAVYRGRFFRHSRDGHIVLPTNPPRKLFLHSDLGFEAAVGVADGVAGDDLVRLGAVRAAVLADVLRAPDFSRRMTFGVVARWDLDLARDGHAVVEQRVSPLTMGAAALHLEAQDGLTQLDLGVEGGAIWSNGSGFGPTLSASASLERVLVAVNDRPLSFYLEGGWDDTRGARVGGGLRFALNRPSITHL